MRHLSFIIWLATAAGLAGGCGGGGPPAPRGDASAATLPGDLEVRLDRVAMARRGVSEPVVADALAAFLSQNRHYTLSQLNELVVHRPAGGDAVRLRDVATIDVSFGPARTDIIFDDRE
jgi:multidrug efflux pump subunit AcrB